MIIFLNFKLDVLVRGRQPCIGSRLNLLKNILGSYYIKISLHRLQLFKNNVKINKITTIRPKYHKFCKIAVIKCKIKSLNVRFYHKNFSFY